MGAWSSFWSARPRRHGSSKPVGERGPECGRVPRYHVRPRRWLENLDFVLQAMGGQGNTSNTGVTHEMTFRTIYQCCKKVSLGLKSVTV